MPAPVWTCHEHVAALRLDPFGAAFCAALPDRGLLFNGPWIGKSILQLLGLAPAKHRADGTSPTEFHARGPDLVVAYEGWAPTAQPPLRVDAVWRALRPGPADAFLAAIELIVSVRMELLDGPAELLIESRLPGEAMFRLLERNPPQCEAMALKPWALLRLIPAEGPGCVLCRLPGKAFTYVEMIHPADFRNDEMLVAPVLDGARLRHHLFPQSLEKGVMLRSRVRGGFLPREKDVALAAACYAAFAASEPPLDAF